MITHQVDCHSALVKNTDDSKCLYSSGWNNYVTAISVLKQLSHILFNFFAYHNYIIKLYLFIPKVILYVCVTHVCVCACVHMQLCGYMHDLHPSVCY